MMMSVGVRPFVIILIFLSYWISETDEANVIMSSEDYIKNLNIPWQNVHYSEYGFPVITKHYQKILEMKTTSFIFNPQYTVLTTVEKDNNMYVSLDNLNNTFFRFFGGKHPHSQNYRVKLESSELKIEGCDTRENCFEISDCERGVIQTEEEELSENVIYMSWELTGSEPKIIKFLIQHKNKTIICNDALRWEFKKLVMQGGQRQNFRQRNNEFKWTTEAKSWISEPTFDLEAGKSVYIQTTQCFHCQTNFSLICNNFSSNAIIEGNSTVGSNRISINNYLNNGWKEIVLPVDPSDEDLEECKLNVVTINGREDGLPPFWMISTSVANVNISTANNSLKDVRTTTIDTTSSTTELPKETTSNGYVRLIIILGIAVAGSTVCNVFLLVLFVVLFLKKETRKIPIYQ